MKCIFLIKYLHICTHMYLYMYVYMHMETQAEEGSVKIDAEHQQDTSVVSNGETETELMENAFDSVDP